MPDSLSPNLRNIGRYALLRELRRDRTSVSYFAMDPVLHREAIIKAVELPLPSATAPGHDAQISVIEQAFVRQTQAAGKLHHPHIVTVFEAGRMRNIGYLAIERVPGRRLHELIAGGWRPQFVHAASIAARIADAIEYAHQQGVAHGHLGPQHVILQESNGVPKIEGFGGWVGGGEAIEDALERTDRVLPYFEDVPEDVRRRDVRAIAALVYMMLTGKAPAATGRHAAEPLIPLKSLRLDTPPALAQLIDDALDPGTQHLRRTAGGLRDAFTSFIWNERAHDVAPATIGIPLAAPPERRQVPRDEPPATPETPDTSDRATADMAVKAGAAADRGPTSVPQIVGRVQSWVGRQRMPIGAAVALLAAGIAAGVLLATLGQRAVKDRTPIAAPATAAAQRAGIGIVLLDIAPWGEVLVDNRALGVSPPLTELQLPAGRHAIEIRFTDGKAVAAQVDVDPARPSKIQHRFQ